MSEKVKHLCVDDLRHAEYYQMQRTFDELYEKSTKGNVFNDLMTLILKRENILLAYRNIKKNYGSTTAGTDGLTMKHIGRLSPEDVVKKVRFIVCESKHGYRPKPVRRKDIPKAYDTSKTRPLGIPCIWDRLIQQCIKQVMEPICEAKFSENSYGFRPNRSVENAIKRSYNLLQLAHCHYVIEFDIKGFFDNVNHQKLIRQIWALGIRDKHLIYVIKQILKAPIKMPNGEIIIPTKGTPQGGIISPLLANIALNELDHWIDSQWQNNPVTEKYGVYTYDNGSVCKGNGYRAMRGTKLKEMYLVRYADDFRIFCKNKMDAEKVKTAVMLWIQDRLKLELSEEKTRVVNANKRYSEFLGFKFRLYTKGNKQVVKAHICDKAYERIKKNLTQQAINIAYPRKEYGEYGEVHLYNAKVLGIQNYYRIATHINLDCSRLHRCVSTVLINRLRKQGKSRVVRTGRVLTAEENKRYGKSKMLRFVTGTNEPIYPIGYIQHKYPMSRKRKSCCYTEEGRKELHTNLCITNQYLMLEMMKQPQYNNSLEFADNRISLFSGQYGKCYVTGKEFLTLDDIHCHHKIPKSKGGTDKYDNLVLILKEVHILVHAKEDDTINYYLSVLQLKPKQLERVNSLRNLLKLEEIKV